MPVRRIAGDVDVGVCLVPGALHQAPRVLDLFAANRLQHKYSISNMPPTACNTSTVSVICRQPPATQIQYQSLSAQMACSKQHEYEKQSFDQAPHVLGLFLTTASNRNTVCCGFFCPKPPATHVRVQYHLTRPHVFGIFFEQAFCNTSTVA